MAELLIGSFSVLTDQFETVDNDTDISWENTENIDSGFTLGYEESKSPKDFATGLKWSVNELIYTDLQLVHDNNLNQMETLVTGIRAGTHPEDSITNISYDNNLNQMETLVTGIRAGTHPEDVITTGIFSVVYTTLEKPVPPKDIRYDPTTDFSITSEKIGFTSNFIQPINFDNLVTPLSPVNSGFNQLPWKKPDPVDCVQQIQWGYGINGFWIGAITGVVHHTDPDAINPPTDPPASVEVIKVVNIVNVVALPSRTPINFTDLKMSYDIDSIAWIFSFDIADQASLDLLKPSGLTTKEFEIDINGEIFIGFIGRTSTSISVGGKREKVKRIKCTGWSRTKLLTFPYAAKRSYVETSSVTPAGILNSELLAAGSGFTGVWSGVSWTLPANVYSYTDKAPMTAISELVKSIGAVIIPDIETKSLTVKARYPISPWQWDVNAADRNLSENQFFTIDTEWIPQESPDSIYIYGEENGVGVKAVKSGTAGILTLPTIVDKHITDTVAGGERGRMEIAKNGFKEIVPITTYVDSSGGIVMPQELIQVTETSGSTYKAMVVGTSISIKRNGNALIQSIQLERHYV